MTISKANGFTVFLVDDDQGMLDALSGLLHDVGYSTKAYVQPRDFLDGHDLYAHGCAVLDLWMPGLSGLDIQRELLKRGVERPVIFLTGSGDIPASVQAMKGGAVDYFQKPVNVDEFLNAVKLAEQRDRIRLQKHEERELIGRRLASLWQVERRIVDLVVRGMRNKEIAARLGITLRTVKEYRGRAMRKLDVENVPELVRALDKASIQPAKQTKYKKIVIDHLYKAIAKVRSQHRHDSVRAQVRYVIEILKRDYGVSVPDSLQKTIARRIKDFNMGQ